MRSPHRIPSRLGSAALMAYSANGQTVLYGNLNAAAGSYLGVSGSGPLCNSFTGAAGLSLSDAKVYVSLDNNAAASFTVALYADSNKVPGAQIKAIGPMSDSSVASPGVYDFAVNPGIALSPNIRYWIGLSSAKSSVASWAWTTSAAGTGNIASEYDCDHPIIGTGGGDGGLTSVGSGKSALPRGAASSLTCSVNGAQFPMQVTAASAAPTPAVAVPALSFYGMTLFDASSGRVRVHIHAPCPFERELTSQD